MNIVIAGFKAGAEARMSIQHRDEDGIADNAAVASCQQGSGSSCR